MDFLFSSIFAFLLGAAAALLSALDSVPLPQYRASDWHYATALSNGISGSNSSGVLTAPSLARSLSTSTKDGKKSVKTPVAADGVSAASSLNTACLSTVSSCYDTVSLSTSMAAALRLAIPLTQPTALTQSAASASDTACVAFSDADIAADWPFFANRALPCGNSGLGSAMKLPSRSHPEAFVTASMGVWAAAWSQYEAATTPLTTATASATTTTAAPAAIAGAPVSASVSAAAAAFTNSIAQASASDADLVRRDTMTDTDTNHTPTANAIASSNAVAMSDNDTTATVSSSSTHSNAGDGGGNAAASYEANAGASDSSNSDLISVQMAVNTDATVTVSITVCRSCSTIASSGIAVRGLTPLTIASSHSNNTADKITEVSADPNASPVDDTYMPSPSTYLPSPATYTGETPYIAITPFSPGTHNTAMPLALALSDNNTPSTNVSLEPIINPSASASASASAGANLSTLGATTGLSSSSGFPSFTSSGVAGKVVIKAKTREEALAKYQAQRRLLKKQQQQLQQALLEEQSLSRSASAAFGVSIDTATITIGANNASVINGVLAAETDATAIINANIRFNAFVSSILTASGVPTPSKDSNADTANLPITETNASAIATAAGEGKGKNSKKTPSPAASSTLSSSNSSSSVLLGHLTTISGLTLTEDSYNPRVYFLPRHTNDLWQPLLFTNSASSSNTNSLSGSKTSSVSGSKQQSALSSRTSRIQLTKGHLSRTNSVNAAVLTHNNASNITPTSFKGRSMTDTEVPPLSPSSSSQDYSAYVPWSALAVLCAQSLPPRSQSVVAGVETAITRQPLTPLGPLYPPVPSGTSINDVFDNPSSASVSANVSVSPIASSTSGPVVATLATPTVPSLNSITVSFTVATPLPHAIVRSTLLASSIADAAVAEATQGHGLRAGQCQLIAGLRTYAGRNRPRSLTMDCNSSAVSSSSSYARRLSDGRCHCVQAPASKSQVATANAALAESCAFSQAVPGAASDSLWGLIGLFHNHAAFTCGLLPPPPPIVTPAGTAPPAAVVAAHNSAHAAAAAVAAAARPLWCPPAPITLKGATAAAVAATAAGAGAAAGGTAGAGAAAVAGAATAADVRLAAQVATLCGGVRFSDPRAELRAAAEATAAANVYNNIHLLSSSGTTVMTNNTRISGYETLRSLVKSRLCGLPLISHPCARRSTVYPQFWSLTGISYFSASDILMSTPPFVRSVRGLRVLSASDAVNNSERSAEYGQCAGVEAAEARLLQLALSELGINGSSNNSSSNNNNNNNNNSSTNTSSAIVTATDGGVLTVKLAQSMINTVVGLGSASMAYTLLPHHFKNNSKSCVKSKSGNAANDDGNNGDDDDDGEDDIAVAPFMPVPCLGIGVIRGVDVERGLVYITAAVPDSIMVRLRHLKPFYCHNMIRTCSITSLTASLHLIYCFTIHFVVFARRFRRGWILC